MTIRNKNFCNIPIADIPADIEYIDCNLRQQQPVTVDGEPVGVELFPGDDTPRTFTRCGLRNCKVPPGSTINGGHIPIVEIGLVISSEDIIIDGVVVDTIEEKVNRNHGYYDKNTLVAFYRDTPIDEEQL